MVEVRSRGAPAGVVRKRTEHYLTMYMGCAVHIMEPPSQGDELPGSLRILIM